MRTPTLRRASAPALAALLIAAIVAGSAGGDERARTAASASASAYALADAEGRKGYVRVTRSGSRSGAGTSVRASTSGGSGSARASAREKDVDIFDGLVTADSVSVVVSASGGSARPSGRVKGLRIDGARRSVPRRGRSYDMAGYGRLVALRRKGGAITGLRARLSTAYRGFPAGSTVTIAYAAAGASDAPPPADEEEGSGSDDDGEGKDKPKPKKKRRESKRLRELKRGDYLFPVGGKNRFSNDWGAFRQFTGSHEGTDIFASAGTPVVALTDGRLFRVGTRRISGNRLWFEDSRGNHFFYGHLSSFAELARNGAQVKQGDILGYVGSTGDAEKTPPHLHFEIHPGGKKAVNPYPFLRTWEGDSGDAAAIQPGALVVVEDYLER